MVSLWRVLIVAWLILGVTVQAVTMAPTLAPTKAPTLAPTKAPTLAPTKAPTLAPTKAPTLAPTKAPTLAPTKVPTLAPTKAPTLAPTKAPTLAPTVAPTRAWLEGTLVEVPIKCSTVNASVWRDPRTGTYSAEMDHVVSCPPAGHVLKGLSCDELDCTPVIANYNSIAAGIQADYPSCALTIQQLALRQALGLADPTEITIHTPRCDYSILADFISQNATNGFTLKFDRNYLGVLSNAQGIESGELKAAFQANLANALSNTQFTITRIWSAAHLVFTPALCTSIATQNITIDFSSCATCSRFAQPPACGPHLVYGATPGAVLGNIRGDLALFQEFAAAIQLTENLTAAQVAEQVFRVGERYEMMEVTAETASQLKYIVDLLAPTSRLFRVVVKTSTSRRRTLPVVSFDWLGNATRAWIIDAPSANAVTMTESPNLEELRLTDLRAYSAISGALMTNMPRLKVLDIDGGLQGEQPCPPVGRLTNYTITPPVKTFSFPEACPVPETCAETTSVVVASLGLSGVFPEWALSPWCISSFDAGYNEYTGLAQLSPDLQKVIEDTEDVEVITLTSNALTEQIAREYCQPQSLTWVVEAVYDPCTVTEWGYVGIGVGVAGVLVAVAVVVVFISKGVSGRGTGGKYMQLR